VSCRVVSCAWTFVGAEEVEGIGGGDEAEVNGAEPELDDVARGLGKGLVEHKVPHVQPALDHQPTHLRPAHPAPRSSINSACVVSCRVVSCGTHVFPNFLGRGELGHVARNCGELRVVHRLEHPLANVVQIPAADPQIRNMRVSCG
jgi:hypothetical protein